MITITSASRELTEVEKYLMTASPEIEVIKDIDDNEIIPVDAYCIFKDEKENGETVELLSILTPDKKAYSCQSATFKRSFNDVANIMNGKPFSIKKISGTTKSGRPFINCVLDINSAQ